MPAPTQAVLAAGTIVKVDDSASPGTYIEIAEPVEIGDTGEQGDFVDVTSIPAGGNKTREFLAGLKTPFDKTFRFRWVFDDIGQIELIDQAEQGNTVSMQVDFSNGQMATFDIALSGRATAAPTPDAALDLLVYGKQTGDTVWSVTV